MTDKLPGEPRLNRLVEGMVRLAGGDHNVRMAASPAGDEIDTVIDAFNMLAEKLLPPDEESQYANAGSRGGMDQADPLTSLLNRPALLLRIKHALENGFHDAARPALLLIELKDFKRTNELLGSKVLGDTVLQELAGRIGAVVSPQAHVARSGGTEFSVLLPRSSPADARRTAAELAQCLNRAIKLNNVRIQPQASIGIRVAEAGQNPEDLIFDAETAIRSENSKDRVPVTVFDRIMLYARTMRRLLETELRDAIANDQLVLHYQPIVELATGRVKGAEALVRWEHPTRGLIMPDEFVPMAEEIDVIIDLGQWVLNNAVGELAHLLADKIVDTDFGMHVNVSATELQRLVLVDEVRDVLRHHSVPAHNLVIELTETAIVKGNELDKYTLLSLKRLGVGIEIDDFGTGYSSISYLRRLPVDRVKADRSLIGDLDTDQDQQGFIASVIQLVHACGLDTLFEGIETASQANYLAKAGCTNGQGYYFSKPLPSSEFIQLLRAEKLPADQR